ncbi:hypothetical protein [Flavobacterium sp.]|uniref:hypothetical protein n=1 Tax=Flavobacterium sp. TaxID=239 RepID=UPI0038FCFD0D
MHLIITAFDGELQNGIRDFKKFTPPGAIPIVVYGESEEVLIPKIESIIEHYKIFNLKNTCVLERDYDLRNLFFAKI